MGPRITVKDTSPRCNPKLNAECSRAGPVTGCGDKREGAVDSPWQHQKSFMEEAILAWTLEMKKTVDGQRIEKRASEADGRRGCRQQ